MQTPTPSLISINLNGFYYEIGLITLPGATVFSCGALAHNDVDSKLYAAVSLDGSTADQDFNVIIRFSNLS
ncbi:MAG: hypothetical protein ACI8P3_004070 [Saprospiraceae bacterium]|jgi:hypothetical protein